MTDVVLTKQRVEPGKEDRLREWIAEVREREDEAVETLENEGMVSEAAFLERADDATYLVYYMECEDFDTAREAFVESDHEIDREHQAVMEDVLEGWENVGDYELLYHLTNPNRVSGPAEEP